MARRFAAVLLGLLLPGTLGGCRTIETKRPVIPGENPVRTGVPARRFEVQVDGAAAGSVLFFEGRGSTHDSLYIVRNPWNQDLGLIDALGRAFRYVPHEEPAWLGSGTVAEGVKRILAASSLPDLSEVRLKPEPAIDRTKEATPSSPPRAGPSQ